MLRTNYRSGMKTMIGPFDFAHLIFELGEIIGNVDRLIVKYEGNNVKRRMVVILTKIA